MATLMGILIAIAGIVSLVCWIMILIKIFNESIGLGILGIICGLFAFVYGWVKVKEYNCKNVMMAWTAAFIVTIVANALGGAAVVRSVIGMAEESGGITEVEWSTETE